MDIEEIITTTMDDGSVSSYQYFSNLKDRKILFNADCDERITERVAMPLLAFEADSCSDPVHLYINSSGGRVFDSLYLCNIIDNYSKPLYIHVLGYAMSMGFLLAIAGRDNPNVHRDCYPFSVYMLHSGSLSVSSDTAKAKSFLNFNSKLEEKEKNYVLSHTTIDEGTYDKFVDVDYWLTAEDALHYGIVDSIVGENNGKK